DAVHCQLLSFHIASSCSMDPDNARFTYDQPPAHILFRLSCSSQNFRIRKCGARLPLATCRSSFDGYSVALGAWLRQIPPFADGLRSSRLCRVARNGTSTRSIGPP